MKLVNNLNAINLEQKYLPYGSDLHCVPDLTLDNFNALLTAHNELVNVVNQLITHYNLGKKF